MYSCYYVVDCINLKSLVFIGNKFKSLTQAIESGRQYILEHKLKYDLFVQKEDKSYSCFVGYYELLGA